MAQVSFSNSQISASNFMAEELTDKVLVPGGARVIASEFFAPDAVRVVVATGGAAANATAIPVDALVIQNGKDIPANTVLDFTGTKKFAVLTAAAVAGATSLTVEALPTALVAGDLAVYSGRTDKPIQAGLLVGRSFADRASRLPFGVADVATDEDIYLIAIGCADANINPEVTLLRYQSLIYEDRLPGWATMTTQQKTKIRSLYQCITSA